MYLPSHDIRYVHTVHATKSSSIQGIQEGRLQGKDFALRRQETPTLVGATQWGTCGKDMAAPGTDRISPNVVLFLVATEESHIGVYINIHA